MDLDAAFEAAVVASKSLPTQPNDTLLELYALYKQSTQGDAEGKRPGAFDFVGRAKYDAWAARSGMTSEAAKQAYVELVERLGQA
jgi:acyl-CoA-binding protein